MKLPANSKRSRRRAPLGGYPSKFGNFPILKSRRLRRDCVPMTVMAASKPSVILLDEKYAPYPRRGVQIENICGIFATYVELGMLHGLIVDTITPFGVQHMLHHVEGNLIVDQGRGFFKGCR